MKKADEWRRLLTVTPVILWACWKDENDEIPNSEPNISANEVIPTTHSRNFRSLYDAILLLCAGVKLLSTKTITRSQAFMGQRFLARYCLALLGLGVVLTPNHHLAMHFAAMILLFGPVYAWWLFAFERFNGMMEKVNNNGKDGGRVELTMLRSWVQAHLLYDYVLELPEDASPHERKLLDEIIRSEASREFMMTEIAILLQESSIGNGISLPKRLSKHPINLANLVLPRQSDGMVPDTYTLIFDYCQMLWPELNLRRQFSATEGTPFSATLTSRRLMYIRKDGLRYGSIANRQTKADTMAYVRNSDTNTRLPVEIVELFLIKIPDVDHAPHACALVRRLFPVDDTLLGVPWFV